MQSHSQVKKIQEYDLGEYVHEGDYCAGRVASIAMHPTSTTVGYMLLVNKDNEYTIYKGTTDARVGLVLTRNIPESVAIQFADAIQGKEPLPSPMKREKKFPVVSKAVQKKEMERQVAGTGSPYFDFV